MKTSNYVAPAEKKARTAKNVLAVAKVTATKVSSTKHKRTLKAMHSKPCFVRHMFTRRCLGLLGETQYNRWRAGWSGHRGVHNQANKSDLTIALQMMCGSEAFGGQTAETGSWYKNNDINLLVQAVLYETTNVLRPNVTFDECFRTSGPKLTKPTEIWGDLTKLKMPCVLRAPEVYRKLLLDPNHDKAMLLWPKCFA
jgi:hypothetical protein